MRTPGTTVFLTAALVGTGLPTLAHHSYGDYEQDERFVLNGTLTEVHWANPHILFQIDDGTHEVRVEWITTIGADRTGATAERFRPGQDIVVVGSRNRNPDIAIVTLVKELSLPAQDWRWVSPARPSVR